MEWVIKVEKSLGPTREKGRVHFRGRERAKRGRGFELGGLDQLDRVPAPGGHRKDKVLVILGLLEVHFEVETIEAIGNGKRRLKMGIWLEKAHFFTCSAPTIQFLIIYSFGKLAPWY